MTADLKSDLLKLLNETGPTISLVELAAASEGWGRPQGREVFAKLVNFIEANAGHRIYEISLKGIKRLDFSFSDEAIVQLARRYRKSKGFVITNWEDPNLIENVGVAAMREQQPIAVRDRKGSWFIGPQPGGAKDALEYAAARGSVRAAEFAAKTKGMKIANASAKFKQLWEQGYMLRRDESAESGGVEYVYEMIA